MNYDVDSLGETQGGLQSTGTTASERNDVVRTVSGTVATGSESRVGGGVRSETRATTNEGKYKASHSPRWKLKPPRLKQARTLAESEVGKAKGIEDEEVSVLGKRPEI